MPTIEWFLNGRRLQQDHNVTITNEFLLIHNTSVEDEGIYQCSASNAAGMVTVQASVDVQSKLTFVFTVYQYFSN